MTQPPSPKTFINTLASAGTIWCLMPENLPNQLQSWAIIGAAATVLSLPDSEQTNVQYATSLATGALIASKFSSKDASFKDQLIFTLFTTATVYLAQELCEQALQRDQSPRFYSLYNYVSENNRRAGPQTVYETAAQQRQRDASRETVGNRL